ncbi:MAG: hypothetical protein IJT94_17220 [Oscillibacter sp.]|nr:hypothetical protein [Oscillibacter sp.]
MRKLTGAALVLLAAALAVRSSLGERRRRRAALNDLARAFRRLAEEVRLSRAPLPALLARLAAGCGPDAAAFFRYTAVCLRRGDPLADAWRDSAADLPLSLADLRTVAELGADLRGDEDRLRRAVLAAADALSKSGAEMDDNWGAELRRTAALSFSAAALAVILLY